MAEEDTTSSRPDQRGYGQTDRPEAVEDYNTVLEEILTNTSKRAV